MHMYDTLHMFAHLEKNQSVKQSPPCPRMQNGLLFETLFFPHMVPCFCSTLLHFSLLNDGVWFVQISSRGGLGEGYCMQD